MAVATMSIWSLMFWGCVAFHVAASQGGVTLIRGVARGSGPDADATADGEGAA